MLAGLRNFYISPGPHPFQFVIHGSASRWAILKQNQIELVTVITFTVRGKLYQQFGYSLKKNFWSVHLLLIFEFSEVLTAKLFQCLIRQETHINAVLEVATFAPRALSPVGKEIGRTPQPVWTMRKEKSVCPADNRTRFRCR